MNRKKFLHAASVAIGAGMLPLNNFAQNKNQFFSTPPSLKRGDTIGITCPSGFMSRAEMLPAFEQIESWGFKIFTGKTVDTKDGTFGGTIAERTRDLQYMLDSPHIHAIMCGRGGYGAVHIIDNLDFSNFVKQPKWLIGFSDATVLHTHINSKLRIATLHSKMLNSFPQDFAKALPTQQATILSIKKALMGIDKMYYTAPGNVHNRPGSARAALVGGNLRTIENLAGTTSEIDTHGRILFLEETGEYLYNIDRMLWNLKRTGKLRHLKGLIFGGMNIKQQTNPLDEMNKTLPEIVMGMVKEYNYPVCFDFPIGHRVDNFALKCGVKHQLSVHTSQTSLTEI